MRLGTSTMVNTMLLRLFVCLSIVLFVSWATPDTIKHDISTQTRCRQYRSNATRNCKWQIGLYDNMDYHVLKGKIAAYKIHWFNGKWSGWFVPGVNDLDWKFNIKPTPCGSFPKKGNTMRRVWSYFYDHYHSYILCRSQ